MADPLRPATRAVHAGRPPHEPDQPLNAPITMASTYVAGGDREYGRYGNPTWHGVRGRARRPGGRPRPGASRPGWPRSRPCSTSSPTARRWSRRGISYNGTLLQLADLESRGRVTTVLVDIDGHRRVRRGADDDVALVWLESPTNPALEVADIATIAAAAHEAGASRRRRQHVRDPAAPAAARRSAPTSCVHSATKYLAGHSDVLMGAVVTGDDELYAVLKGRRDLLGAIPGTVRGLARAARAAHPARARGARPGERRRAGPPPGRPPGGHRGPLPRASARWSRSCSPAARRRRPARRARPGSGSTPPRLGGVESTLERRRRWTQPSPARSPTAWCGSRSASRTSRTSGRPGAGALGRVSARR